MSALAEPGKRMGVIIRPANGFLKQKRHRFVIICKDIPASIRLWT
ncbi:hypothetical protein SAMN04487972_105125 [Paracoccus halophilus]|uniref:Uncharacterized protein n=1 Tax=Paracoccus halophilus TaxID=376733 RepID=A0A1I0T9M6_9RHOB|nr:hypothetical protein [Paracoccus halophilus]SFA47726.1 hypothetical protein SAMN04487972_105125 [Paracoccus halophilus]